MIKGVDYIGVTVSFFCHDGKGNFIFAKRSKNARDEHGRWDNGGGGLEFRENVEDSLRKEIKEEYCTDVLDYEFLGYREAHREDNGKKTHWISLDFKVLIDPSRVRNGELHKFDEVGWFKLTKLPDPIHSMFPVAFEKYKDKLMCETSQTHNSSNLPGVKSCII